VSRHSGANSFSTQKRKGAKTQRKGGVPFGLRWQSAAATPLLDCGQSIQSGVALRFPPQKELVASMHLVPPAARQRSSG